MGTIAEDRNEDLVSMVSRGNVAGSRSDSISMEGMARTLSLINKQGEQVDLDKKYRPSIAESNGEDEDSEPDLDGQTNLAKGKD